MKIFEIAAASKAGFIPYQVVDGEVKMLFMISSDARYGGADPMLSKGHVDPGEAVDKAAIREAEEELGLRPSNLVSGTVKLGWHGALKGMTADYVMSIYVGQIKDMHAFDKPHYETEKTVWLTLEEFLAVGRKSQANIVRACAAKIDHGLQ